jgi:hypothetical protein
LHALFGLRTPGLAQIEPLRLAREHAEEAWSTA